MPPAPTEAPFNTKLASTRLNCLWQQQATVGLCFWVPPKGQPPLPKRCLLTPSLPLERPCVPHGTEQRHGASFVDLPLSGNSCTTLQLDGDPCHDGVCSQGAVISMWKVCALLCALLECHLHGCYGTHWASVHGYMCSHRTYVCCCCMACAPVDNQVTPVEILHTQGDACSQGIGSRGLACRT